MNRALAVKLLCCLSIANTASDGEEEWAEEELGTVPEDMAEYQWQGGVRYSTEYRDRAVNEPLRSFTVPRRRPLLGPFSC